MLKLLIKTRFSALFASITQGSEKKKNKKRKKGAVIGVIILFAFLCLYILGALSIIFYGISTMTKETGDGWAVFLLGSMIASLLCLFGSIFATKTQIFESKDNELLLAMPIKPRDIFISRMLTLLLVNYMLEALIMVPCMVMYGIGYGYTALGFVLALGTFILIPFLTLALSSIIAWIISEISSRMKNKHIVTTVLFAIFFLAYMYFAFMLGMDSGEMEEGEIIDFSGLKRIFLFWWVGNAVANESLLSFLFFALCAIIPSVITYMVLNTSFIRIITTKKAKAKTKYTGNKEAKSGVLLSLFKKEIRKLLSSSSYMLNTGIGTIFSLVVAIFVAVNSDTALKIFSSDELGINSGILTGLIAVIVVGVCAFVGGMNLISAPSISLENDTLWILQSMPIDPKDIFKGKLYCHIAVCTPFSVVSALIIAIAFKIGVIYTILTLLATALIVVFNAYFGLLLGLRFPKFGWQNENVAVKQGFAVFGAMCGSMIFTIIIMAGGMALSLINGYLAMIVIIAITVALTLPIHFYLMNGGKEAFNNLKKS